MPSYANSNMRCFGLGGQNVHFAWRNVARAKLCVQTCLQTELLLRPRQSSSVHLSSAQNDEMKLRACNVLHSAPAVAAVVIFTGFLAGMIELQRQKSKDSQPNDVQLWLSRGAGTLANFYSAALGPTPECAGTRMHIALVQTFRESLLADNALWMYTQDKFVLSTEANQISNEFGAIFSVDTRAESSVSFRCVDAPRKVFVPLHPTRL